MVIFERERESIERAVADFEAEVNQETRRREAAEVAPDPREDYRALYAAILADDMMHLEDLNRQIGFFTRMRETWKGMEAKADYWIALTKILIEETLERIDHARRQTQVFE